MKRLGLMFLVLLMFFASGALAKEIEVASKVTALAVSGNQNVSEQVILGAVITKVNESISDEKIRTDLKALYSLGYFADVSVSFEAYKDGTKIIYNVKENPLLKSLSIVGNTVYSTEVLTQLMGLNTGEVFNYQKFRAGIEAINQKYKTDGYIMARIVDISAEAGVAQIKLVEGVVEGVSLEGNESTRDYVILREMDLKPGMVFNEQMLSKDLRRIFNLNFFSELNPAFEPGSSPDKIHLVLKMKETRTNTINFGGGYGEREGWFGFADLAVNNLMGTAQGLMLRGQSGQQLSTYQFKYTNPWFWPEKLGPRTSYSLRLWDTLGTDIYVLNQDERHTGWDMSLGKTVKDTFGSSFFFGAENVAPRGSATFEAYSTNYVGATLSYDTRDFWLNPKKGVYHLLSYKQGWTTTISNVKSTYSKISLDLNGFRPALGENQVLASHLGVGTGIGNVPIGELFWCGGPNTVRGYGMSEIRRAYQKLIFNIEYRWTFNEMFQAVFFYDWGNVWNSGYPDFSSFMAGWGPGVRLNTPLGPIRLDYGVATSRTFGDGILHFSMGQAF